MSIDFCLINENKKIVCDGYGSNAGGSLYCFDTYKVIAFLEWTLLNSDGVVKVGKGSKLQEDYESEGYTIFDKSIL